MHSRVSKPSGAAPKRRIKKRFHSFRLFPLSFGFLLRKAGHFFFGLGLVVAASGCATHLHDDSRQAVADKARDQAAALVKAEQQMFDVMASNLATMSSNEEETFKRLDADVVAAQTRIVGRMTWKELRTKASSAGPSGGTALTKDLESRVISIVTDINGELVSAQAASGKAKQSLDAANDELAQAKARLTKWNKQIAVLEKTIELTPSALNGNSIKSLDDFGARMAEVAKLGKEAKIIYTDGDGNTVTNDFETAVSTLADHGDALANGDIEAGKLQAGIKSIFTPDAPGLVLTAASLAKDLADAQRRRVLAQIDTLNQRLDIAMRAQTNLAQAKEFTQQLSGAISDSGVFKDDDQVAATLLKLSGDVKNADNLAKGLRAAEYYVAVAGPLTLQVQAAEREVYEVRHLDSIQQSKLAASEHEALVARGVEALAIYHDGGVKPQEIADLAYRVVQLGLLGWIGAGVH